MQTLARRILVIAALMFWQGGFTFYAAIVVPIGQDTLGALDQGLLTRQVTNYLNVAGAVCLALLAWDLRAKPSTAKPWDWLRSSSWLGMVMTLVFLAILHHRLDRLLDLDAGRILDRGAFRVEHRWYLWVSTAQWAMALLFLAGTLRVWAVQDAGEGA
jgi:hypothetical protein